MAKDSSNYVFVRARVPKDIHLKFKIASLEEETDMDTILNGLIVQWLKDKGKLHKQ